MRIMLLFCHTNKHYDSKFLVTREQWPVATVYSNEKKARSVGFRRIYLMLDEATLTFNSSADEVIVENLFP